MKAAVLPAIFLVLIGPSCARKHEASSYKVEMADGVKVLRNFKTDSSRAFKPLEFEVDLSIGVEEGRENYMFVHPVDEDSDRSGNIYVLDHHDCVVKKYDSRGIFLKQFGRKGQGPSEFQYPDGLRLSDRNEIYVNDHNKIEVFSASGEYQKTIVVEVLDFFDIVENGDLIIDHRTSDKDGNLYSSLGRWDFLSHRIRDFLSQRTFWPARFTDDEFAYEFPYFLRWCVSPKMQIFAASGVDYAIHVFDSRGNQLFRFMKDFTPVPVAGEEKKKVESIQAKVSTRIAENPYGAKLVYPAFKNISVDENNRIWVEQYQPDWRNRVHKETFYDVFSADGIFLFSTKIPGHLFSQLKFKNGFLYALKKNDSGLVAAVRIKMKE